MKIPGLLKRPTGETITVAQVQAIQDELEEEDMLRAILPART